MSRKPSHKALVNAIIDGEVEAAEIAKRAAELGRSLGERMTMVAKAIVRARAKGTITPQQARDAYVTAFRGASLAGFTNVAQEILDHSDKVTEKIHTEAKKLGPEETRQLEAIRKPDFTERALELRGGLPNGNTP